MEVQVTGKILFALLLLLILLSLKMMTSLPLSFNCIIYYFSIIQSFLYLELKFAIFCFNVRHQKQEYIVHMLQEFMDVRMKVLTA